MILEKPNEILELEFENKTHLKASLKLKCHIYFKI